MIYSFETMTDANTLHIQYMFMNSALELLCGLESRLFSTHSKATDCLSGLHTDSDQLEWEIKYCWRVRRSGTQSQTVSQTARQSNSSLQSDSKTDWQLHRLQDRLNRTESHGRRQGSPSSLSISANHSFSFAHTACDHFNFTNAPMSNTRENENGRFMQAAPGWITLSTPPRCAFSGLQSSAFTVVTVLKDHRSLSVAFMKRSAVIPNNLVVLAGSCNVPITSERAKQQHDIWSS